MASTSTSTEEYYEETPELLQRKLYFLLEQLQNMHQNLPPEYQMRIPYELLSGLANALLNDTILEIVKGLMEIQHVNEKQMFQQRLQTIRKQEDEIQDALENKHLNPEEKARQITLLMLKHRDELKLADIKTILELDQKAKDQQEILEKAGVPGFHYTTNKQEIKVQMHLLDFILRLSKLKFSHIG